MHPSPTPEDTPASLPTFATGPRLAWRPAARGAAAEAAARAWVASLKGVDGATIAIARDGRGRPRIPGSRDDVGWSHSGDGLLLAFGEALRVGVDLERVRPRPNALALARRFFARGEAAWLEARPAARVEGDFLRLWCAKEALLKAHGEGLSFGLHRLRFAPGADGALALVECDAALGDAACWRVHEWSPRPGYRAALAWRPAE